MALARSRVETRCFETDRDKTRRDFGVAKPRRDFGVSRPRRDRRLYISWFSLSQAYGVRVGSRSTISLVRVETKLVV